MPVRGHTQNPADTKDTSAATGPGRAFTANVPFGCRFSEVPGQKRAGSRSSCAGHRYYISGSTGEAAADEPDHRARSDL